MALRNCSVLTVGLKPVPGVEIGRCHIQVDESIQPFCVPFAEAVHILASPGTSVNRLYPEDI